MKKGKNETGWTTPKKGERSVRDREHGLAGQEIWYKLEKLGFVHDELNDQFRFYPKKHGSLDSWENKLKNWLIWGYWETR